MAICITCPHCSRGLKLGTRQAGTSILCPVCEGTIEVPAAETAISPRPRTVRRPLPERAPAPKTRPVVRPRSGINYPVVAAAAGASFVFVVGLVVVSAVLVARSRTPAEPVAVAAPHVEVVAEGTPPDEEPIRIDAAPALDLMAQTAPAAAPIVIPEPPAARQILEARRNKLADEDLRRSLLNTVEVRLDDERGFKTPEQIIEKARRSDKPTRFSPLTLLDQRADLAGLPLRREPDCQLGREPAENLQTFSRKMRTALAAAGSAANPEAAADVIRRALDEMTGYRKVENGHRTNFQEAVIPTAMQMLCIEHRPIRLVMIEYLSKVEDAAAGEALAKMAIFDLSEKIRAEAIRALATRPRAQYRSVLLKGLRYPWAPVADHAAEALVALEDRGAVAELKTLLAEPDPSVPYFDRSKDSYMVREVVRINHLGNCLMCHAPSMSTTDPVRGRIAIPGEALPPPVQYYESNEGIFVRADVTYLKQDFSVMQPVEKNGAWPTMQRFDFLVRTRPMRFDDGEDAVKSAKRYASYPQREAVRYALKELEVDARPPGREAVSVGSVRP